MTRSRSSRGTVIDKLRGKVPGKWTYEPDTGRGRGWRHESGRLVVRCSVLAPQFDGDDDSFEIQYRWHHNGERIYI